MACESFHPHWHFSYFIASFDLHNVPTTLKMQNIFFIVKQEIRQKTENFSVHKYSSPQSQYFVEPPFSAITAASLLRYVSISLAHLDTGILPNLQGKTAPAPLSLMGSAVVQQSLSQTTNSELN